MVTGPIRYIFYSFNILIVGYLVGDKLPSWEGVSHLKIAMITTDSMQRERGDNRKSHHLSVFASCKGYFYWKLSKNCENYIAKVYIG